MRVRGADTSFNPRRRITAGAVSGFLTSPPSIKFSPKIKLDISQVRDRRGDNGIGSAVVNLVRQSIGGYQGAIHHITYGGPTAAQLSARKNVLRPRRIKIGSLKTRGGK